MDVGWRVVRKDDGRQGLVKSVLFQNAKDENGDWREEVEVDWDDGKPSWEMRGDIARAPTKVGDQSRIGNTGMGVRLGESQGTAQVWIKPDSSGQLMMLSLLGLLKIPKLRQSNTSPAKPQPDERRLKLAAVVATREPILVRRGMLKRACNITARHEPRLGWAARAIKLGPKKVIRRHSRW